MRTRTLALAITTLLVAAGPAQAHGHHDKRHKPRSVDVQLLSINDSTATSRPRGP